MEARPSTPVTLVRIVIAIIVAQFVIYTQTLKGMIII